MPRRVLRGADEAAPARPGQQGAGRRAEKETRMNLDKFTDRARSAVQAAQTLALRAGHQR
jgi:hypothetical protein